MIREKIKAELVAAMKEHNEAKVSILRMIGATLKDKDIAARPSGKTDGISDDETNIFHHDVEGHGTNFNISFDMIEPVENYEEVELEDELLVEFLNNFS